MLDHVLKLNPDIVVCGMGTPTQELFLADLVKMGWEGNGFTCGGFFHQTKSEINYYPNFIDRFHLRYFYRLYKEPYLIKRVGSYFLFLLFFLIDAINYIKMQE